MGASPDSVQQVVQAFRAAARDDRGRAATPDGDDEGPRFVTISRQAGAGGRALAGALVGLLNDADPGDRPWTCWDRERIERLASEHRLPPDVLERFAAPPVPWIQLFVNGLSRRAPGGPDEFLVYRRTALNVRGLARLGRCVIVGRGAACATDDLPGGVHVRLVAPLDVRIARVAEASGATTDDAARTVVRLDRERAALYRRYWPHKPLIAERFGVTLNAAVAPPEALARCVLPLVVPGCTTGDPVAPAEWRGSARVGRLEGEEGRDARGRADEEYVP